MNLSNFDPVSLPFNPAHATVMHIDLNSCFATVEQQANPLLRGKPVAVAAYTTPNGCIIAPSIEAKKLGIKVGMRVRDGKSICPELVILAPDPWKYRYINRGLLKLLSVYSCDITVKSIDEMVLNFKNSPSGFQNLEKRGAEIKLRIKKEIGEHLTVSIGIAPNRFLAKTASSLHKPDGLDIIDKDNFREIYKSLMVENLCGIKINNASRLHGKGIFNVYDMYGADAVKLKSAFESILGYYWYLRLRGYEIDGVEFGRKSYGQSYAIYKATGDEKMLSRILCKLVEKMGFRLRNAGYCACGIHVACLFSDYTFWHRSEKTEKTLYSSNDLYRQALKVLLSSHIKKPVRTIAVSCFGLKKNIFSQMTLLENEERKRNLTRSLDLINGRFGNFSIYPATMMETGNLVPDRIAFGGIKELEEFLFRDNVESENYYA